MAGMEIEKGASAEPLQEEEEAKGNPCLQQCCIGFCCCCWTSLIILGLTVPLMCATGTSGGRLGGFQQSRPPITGTYDIGTLRGRLPAAAGRDCGLYVQVSYPRDAAAAEFDDEEFPLWRTGVMNAMSNLPDGFPYCLTDAIVGDQSPLDPPGKPLASPDGSWPIVIFSSGLFGALEIYMQFCRDMASFGAIVIAIEHEDGAGLYATDCEDNVIPYTVPPQATPGVPLREDIRSFREPMLRARANELNATIEVIQAAINTPPAEPSAIQTVFATGDLDRFVISGHSFGGATVWFYTQYLASLGIPTPFAGALYMDIWGATLTDAEISSASPEPFVQLTSTDWQAQDFIRTMISSSPLTALANAQFLGSVHQWIADSSFFFPYWISKNAGAVGPGDHPAVFTATMKAVRDSLEAYFDPSLRPALNETILAINPTVLVPF